MFLKRSIRKIGIDIDNTLSSLDVVLEAMAKHYDKLTALHLSDNDGVKDRHWVPFDGEIDFASRVTPYLKKTDVPYTMELVCDKEKYPEEAAFLKVAKERTDRLLALEDMV